MKIFSISFFLIVMSFFIHFSPSFASIKGEWEDLKNKNELFDKKIEDSINSTFNLDIDGYESIDEYKLALLTERDKSLLDLLKLTNNLRKNGCIGSPIIYLKPQQAYVLMKDNTEKNVLISLSKVTNNHWKIISVKKK